MIYEFDIASYDMAASIPDATIYEARTAADRCLRMQVDKKPFDDRRVRRPSSSAATRRTTTS